MHRQGLGLILSAIEGKCELVLDIKRFKKNDMFGVIVEIIVVILLSFLFDYLCKKYGQNVSWYGLILIIVLPYILSSIMFYVMMREIKK